MIEYNAGFEVPYPAKTYTQAYLDAMFRNAVELRGDTRFDAQFDPDDPYYNSGTDGLIAPSGRVTSR